MSVASTRSCRARRANALRSWYTLLCVTLVDVKARNITFNLPADLLQQAKIYSAEHGTTVNSLIRELLQERLTREGRTRAAIDRILALAERGPYFSIDPGTIRRDELHDRR